MVNVTSRTAPTSPKLRLTFSNRVDPVPDGRTAAPGRVEIAYVYGTVDHHVAAALGAHLDLACGDGNAGHGAHARHLAAVVGPAAGLRDPEQIEVLDAAPEVYGPARRPALIGIGDQQEVGTRRRARHADALGILLGRNGRKIADLELAPHGADLADALHLVAVVDEGAILLDKASPDDRRQGIGAALHDLLDGEEVHADDCRRDFLQDHVRDVHRGRARHGVEAVSLASRIGADAGYDHVAVAAPHARGTIGPPEVAADRNCLYLANAHSQRPRTVAPAHATSIAPLVAPSPSSHRDLTRTRRRWRAAAPHCAKCALAGPGA
jgi:hypothetical protein